MGLPKVRIISPVLLGETGSFHPLPRAWLTDQIIQLGNLLLCTAQVCLLSLLVSCSMIYAPLSHLKSL